MLEINDNCLGQQLFVQNCYTFARARLAVPGDKSKQAAVVTNQQNAVVANSIWRKTANCRAPRGRAA
jgi:hypothetical protein